MGTHSRRSGFSIVEVLTTVAVTTVVMAGVVVTFNRITRSANNATRGSDLTNSTRGLGDMLRYDFAMAGKGINDLNALNIRHRFTDAFSGRQTGDPEPEPFLYGIADVSEDANGFSEISLHWFDYDLTAGDSARNPTFIASGVWLTGATQTGPVILQSNNTDALDGLESGDMLLFYKLHIFNQEDSFQTSAIWNAGITDNNGDPANEAIVLQVDQVIDPTLGLLGFSDLAGVKIVTFTDGTVFSNTFPTDNILDIAFEDYIGGLTSKLDATLNMPNYVFLARKLGDKNSFNRVQYKVDRESSTDPWVLLRTHNGVEEVVATRVTQFQVRLGLDVPIGRTPGAVDRDDMDGYVTSLNPASWTGGFADSSSNWGSLTTSQFVQIIGRHTIAATVSFTQESAVKDTGDADQSVKQRSFVRIYPTSNNTLPMPNL